MLKQWIESDFLGLVTVFVSSDGTGIAVGDQWLQDVLDELRAADLYLVLCSQNSVERLWINIEIGAALSRSKQIVPVYHTDLRTEEFLRRPLSDYEGLDASDPRGLEKLYRVLSSQLGSNVPSVDFDKMSEEVQAFETRYLEQKKTLIISSDTKQAPDEITCTLRQPTVLCVSSDQFLEAAADTLEQFRKAFPAGSRHEVITTASGLGEVLVREHFDILHVAAFTCPITGDVVFNAVDPVTKRALTETRDAMPAETFVRLVKESGACLVVLANNETLPLMAKLLPVTSVVFALEPVDLKTLTAWTETFYNLLLGGFSLAQSCRKAFGLHQIPMMPYPRVAHPPESARTREPDRPDRR